MFGMRTFFCSAFHDSDAAPRDAVIVASDEWRALDLLRRELADAARGVHVEIRERGQVLFSGFA